MLTWKRTDRVERMRDRLVGVGIGLVFAAIGVLMLVNDATCDGALAFLGGR